MTAKLTVVPFLVFFKQMLTFIEVKEYREWAVNTSKLMDVRMVDQTNAQSSRSHMEVVMEQTGLKWPFESLLHFFAAVKVRELRFYWLRRYPVSQWYVFPRTEMTCFLPKYGTLAEHFFLACKSFSMYIVANGIESQAGVENLNVL